MPASQCWCSRKLDLSNARLLALQAQLARSAFTRPAEVSRPLCPAQAHDGSPPRTRCEERASCHWRQSPRARRRSCLARCLRGAARPAELALRRVGLGLRHHAACFRSTTEPEQQLRGSRRGLEHKEDARARPRRCAQEQQGGKAWWQMSRHYDAYIIIVSTALYGALLLRLLLRLRLRLAAVNALYAGWRRRWVRTRKEKEAPGEQE